MSQVKAQGRTWNGAYPVHAELLHPSNLASNFQLKKAADKRKHQKNVFPVKYTKDFLNLYILLKIVQKKTQSTKRGGAVHIRQKIVHQRKMEPNINNGSN